MAYQSGTPASRQAVSRTLDLLERQGQPPLGPGPRIDVNALKLWIRAAIDPIGSRSQFIPYLHTIADSPPEEPALWGAACAAWILDESELAVRWLQDAMHRRRAPGMQGISAGGLTALGWAYTDTVLALRADPAAARRYAARALADVESAVCGLVVARARRAIVVAAFDEGSYLQAFTQLRGLFSDDGTPLHNYASYLGVADLAAAAVRADRRTEGRDIIEYALSPLNGRVSPRLEQLVAGPAASSPTHSPQKPSSTRRSPIPPGIGGRSSGPSSASSTPNGCGGAAGSTTPSPSWPKPWEPSGGSAPGPARSGRRQS